MAVKATWFRLLNNLGNVEYPRQVWQRDLREYVVAGPRSDWPGASRHAVDVQTAGGQGAWLRYLQDHATKTKQEQIGVGLGRHWGVMGRRHLARVLPDRSCEMTERQYARFLRAWQRLATPRVPVEAPGKSRTYKLGFRPRRGRRGAAVAFSKPETIVKLVEWARSEP
jgi:hypothetical protein